MHASVIRAGVAVAALSLAPAAGATTLVHMNIKDLAGRADRIFRGTVVGIDTGTLRAGGGDLPTVTYRLRVDEVFKGSFADGKEAQPVVALRMVGALKEAQGSGRVRRLSVLRDVPRLEMNQDYVLFTTRASGAGLSTTVGLGQGAFTIYEQGKQELAVNTFDNLGLNRGLDDSVLPSRGPVSYQRLAQAIRAALGQQ